MVPAIGPKENFRREQLIRRAGASLGTILISAICDVQGFWGGRKGCKLSTIQIIDALQISLSSAELPCVGTRVTIKGVFFSWKRSDV